MPSDQKPSLTQTGDHSAESSAATTHSDPAVLQSSNNTTVDGASEQQAKGQSTDLSQAIANSDLNSSAQPEQRPVEHGGQAGPEPTRYGDWEKKGRCTDF